MSVIVDFHIHYPEDMQLEALVRTCENLGVVKVCMLSLGKWRNNVNENILVEKAMKEYPDLIVGFAYVALGRDPPDIVDEFHSRGFRGIKLIDPAKPYDVDEFFDYYERMEDYNLLALFHTGIVARGARDREWRVSSEFMRPVRLDRIARVFPKLRIIGAHLGHPWCDEAAVVMMHNSNVYFDISGGHTFWVALAIRRRGRYDVDPARLLFGSDAFSPRVIERMLRFWEVALPQLGLNKEEVAWVLGKNALKLLGST